MIDFYALSELLLDLDCMTAFRHVRANSAVSALYGLLQACSQENAGEEALTNAYCAAYDAWLAAASEGKGGFAREAVEAVLFEDSAAAQLCARMDADKLPYSLVNAMAHDLDALGRLTAIEPAMFLLLCQRVGMSSKVAARLPVWEPALGCEPFDPRIEGGLLTREGAKLAAAFFRKHVAKRRHAVKIQQQLAERIEIDHRF